MVRFAESKKINIMDPDDMLFERDFEELKLTVKEYINATAKLYSAWRRLGIATRCVLVLSPFLRVGGAV